MVIKSLLKILNTHSIIPMGQPDKRQKEAL